MDRICPVCGAPCAPDEIFCRVCGTKLPDDAPAYVPASQQGDEAPAYVPASQQTDAAPATPVYQPSVNYAPQQNAYSQANYAPPPYAAPVYGTPAPPAKQLKKKKTGLIIGLCTCAAVLIAAAIVLYFFVFTPNSVTLSEVSKDVSCCESFELTAEIHPGSAILSKDVTWSSSDESVARVDGEGRVTALKSGTCTITATTGNGKRASCAVTVAVAPTDLYLSFSGTEVEVGDSFTLEAELYPADARSTITWTSSNESVASVDADGNVTAKSAGFCVITAATSNGLMKTCELTVGVQPTSLYLSESHVDLTVGDSYIVTPDVYPENAVNYTITWSSSKTSVATVSDGRITAVGKGTCTVTATTYNGISATCAVVVAEKAVEVKSVSLSDKQIELNVNDKYTLTATVSPDNATNPSLTWSSSKTSVATVSDGVVTAVGAGTCEITAAASNGKRASCTVTVIAAKPASSSQIAVGDIILFGTYEQDNYTYNGTEDIEWIVLDKQGSSVLIISRYALDCKLFNGSMTNATWDTSSLRSWLNDTFYYSAFSSSERNRIQNTTVYAEMNPTFSTYAGGSTYDKVFLLSIPEATRYFGSDAARGCKGTAYCYAQGAYVGNGGNCWWWLRTPGDRNGSAANVGSAGGIHYNGNDADSAAGAVRPAMWITVG